MLQWKYNYLSPSTIPSFSILNQKEKKVRICMYTEIHTHRDTQTHMHTHTHTCTHTHTHMHTHTRPWSKAIEGRSLLEGEVRSSSLLVEVYQWGPIKECLLCMFQKICCYDADSGPCETEDISQKNRSLGRS